MKMGTIDRGVPSGPIDLMYRLQVPCEVLLGCKPPDACVHVTLVGTCMCLYMLACGFLEYF
jgi:hypothetical protein